jgi:hypothetical protein
MGDYRHIDTGEIKSQGQWRNHYKNTSLPRTWTAATLAGLKLEPVFETPKPDAGQYQNAVRNGVEKDANGNWVWAWLSVTCSRTIPTKMVWRIRRQSKRLRIRLVWMRMRLRLCVTSAIGCWQKRIG